MATVSRCCGFSHHIEISMRALSQFHSSEAKQVIENNMNYFYGGSPFPDWAYLCPIDGTFNEYAHWPPFTEIFVKYIREGGFNESKKQKLIAFLMGVVSHMETDVLWHWGQTHSGEQDQGFLRGMAHLGSYCNDLWNSGKTITCHKIGDIGGELYLRARGNIFNGDGRWSFPFDDIINIYDIEDHDKYKIHRWKLRGCLLLMYIARHLEWIVSELAYQIFSSKATFLTENIHRYYSGGLDDNAYQVEYKLNQTFRLLNQTGTDDDANDDVSNRSKLYGDDQATAELFRQIHSRKIDMNRNINQKQQELEELQELYQQIVDVQYFDGDLHLAIHQHKINYDFKLKAIRLFAKLYELDVVQLLDNFRNIENQKQDNYRSLKQNIMARQLLTNTGLKQILRQENNDFGYFGSSLVVGNFNRQEKGVIISSPGFIDQNMNKIGKLYKYDSIVNLNSEDKEFELEMRSSVNSQFGDTMVSVDLNNDGYDDLIVAAPLNSEKVYSKSIEQFYALNYTGLVNIYLSTRNGLELKTQIRHSLRKTHDSLMLGRQIYYHSYQQHQYLVMSSPYAYIDQTTNGWQGEVIIFNNISKLANQDSLSTVANLTTNDGQYLRNNISYEMFGKAVSCYQGYLIVGAPGHRGNDDPMIQSTGIVYIYKLDTLQLVSQIVSDLDQSQFGDQIAVQNDILVVSAKSQNTEQTQAGAVYFFDFQKMLEQRNNSIKDCKAVIKGQNNQARFGSFLKIVGKELVIGAPLYSSWNGWFKYSTERGAVFFVYGFEKLEGQYRSDEYSKLEGQNSGSRFGSYIEYCENKLFISAPFESYPSGSNIHNRFRGAVYVYNH